MDDRLRRLVRPVYNRVRDEVADAMADLGYEVAETDPSSPEVVGTRE